MLGAYFHRSRVVLFSLGLVVMHAALTREPSDPSFLFLMGGVLSLLMGTAAFFQDRGLFSSPGLAQAGVVVLALAFGWLVVSLSPGDIGSFLDLDMLPGDTGAGLRIPQPVFFTFLISIPASFCAALLRKGPVERGFFWSLVLLMAALHLFPAAGGVDLLLCGAGVLLGLSVLETSYAMAYRDDLTGLPARRALLRDLHAMGGAYSAAMVDVDHFKRFNDRYGHDVGDQVLRMVAARLAKTTGGGRAYRYGGEEFTLLFPGKNLQEALPHLKEVRRSVEEAVFTLRSWRRPRKKPVNPGAWRTSQRQAPRRLSVTVSVGVADTSAGDPSPDAVLKRADRALYRAKKAGRNRVMK